MKMSKRQYRIGEMAKQLNIQKFVLRFWERELNIKPHRSTGGQRFYEEEDFETFKLIKTLLYERKFTLAGAKKELEILKTNKKTVIGSQKITLDTMTSTTKHNGMQNSSNILNHTLLNIKQKLQQLQELL